jgi:uncharacterized protein YndB with AHSA1/START domain
MTTATETDRIVKTTVLRAPVERVWRAIADSREFGTWFGMEIDGPFVAGSLLQGRATPTKVDPEMAKMQEPHAGKRLELRVEAVEPQRRVAFRWQPADGEKGAHATGEQNGTLVELQIEAVPEGTRLTIVESGFDAMQPEQRARSLKGNDQGWTMQLRAIALYVEQDEAAWKP